MTSPKKPDLPKKRHLYYVVSEGWDPKDIEWWPCKGNLKDAQMVASYWETYVPKPGGHPIIKATITYEWVEDG